MQAPPSLRGFLLEQLASHMARGLAHVLDQVGAQGLVTPPGAASKASCTQWANALLASKACKAFEAARSTTEIVAWLQHHYTTVILPHVAPVMSEHSACNQGLVALLQVRPHHHPVFALRLLQLAATQPITFFHPSLSAAAPRGLE